MSRRPKRLNAGKKLATILEREKETIFSPRSQPLSLTPPDIVDCKCGVKEDDHKHMVMCCCCAAWSHSACYGLSKGEAIQTSFTCVGCRSPTPSSSVSHQLATEHLQRTNASPVRIGDGVCPEDDVNLESQQERTTKTNPLSQ